MNEYDEHIISEFIEWLDEAGLLNKKAGQTNLDILETYKDDQ